MLPGEPCHPLTPLPVFIGGDSFSRHDYPVCLLKYDFFFDLLLQWEHFIPGQTITAGPSLSPQKTVGFSSLCLGSVGNPRVTCLLPLVTLSPPVPLTQKGEERRW